MSILILRTEVRHKKLALFDKAIKTGFLLLRTEIFFTERVKNVPTVYNNNFTYKKVDKTVNVLLIKYQICVKWNQEKSFCCFSSKQCKSNFISILVLRVKCIKKKHVTRSFKIAVMAANFFQKWSFSSWVIDAKCCPCEYFPRVRNI